MSGTKIVAVACESREGLAGDVSGHFGHAPYFVVAELAGTELVGSRLVESPAHGEGPCTAPEFVRRTGATAVLVGGMGARAVAMLRGMGIEVYGGASGNAGAALRALAAGTLVPADGRCSGHGEGGHTCGHH